MMKTNNGNVYERFIYISGALAVYLFMQYYGLIEYPIFSSIVPFKSGKWLNQTFDSNVRTVSEAVRVCMLANIIGLLVFVRSIVKRKSENTIAGDNNLIYVSLIMSLLSTWLLYSFFSTAMSDDVQISQMSTRSFLLDFVLTPLSAPIMLWLGLVVAYDAIRGKFN